jgi:protein PhnA
MSDEMQPCPQCKSPYGYLLKEQTFACPECAHEWELDSGSETEISDEGLIIVDANGNPLADGDSVIVIKDLPVKGAPKPVKAGTKVKNIRLVDGDHNIDCKIPGFGAMALKSEFVKKG